MPGYGLIGYPLSHSFSKNFFEEKFRQLNLADHVYNLYPLKDLSYFPFLVDAEPGLLGLNVTIPYKEKIIEYMDVLKGDAIRAEAVNTIKIVRSGAKKELVGYNTDVHGFRQSLGTFLPDGFRGRALILGSGGASKAVKVVLEEMKIEFNLVSRFPARGHILYEDIDEGFIQEVNLIINTTPAGMYPDVENFPPLPYHAFPPGMYLHDLIYNPGETLFLRKGKENGATIKNGLEMLHFQAEQAWEIWK